MIWKLVVRTSDILCSVHGGTREAYGWVGYLSNSMLSSIFSQSSFFHIYDHSFIF